MIIYHLSDSNDKVEINKSIEFKNENEDFIYSVYYESNISQTLNVCYAVINHDNVKDGPMRK